MRKETPSVDKITSSVSRWRGTVPGGVKVGGVGQDVSGEALRLGNVINIAEARDTAASSCIVEPPAQPEGQYI